ncbi:hypothetical protein MMC30_005503 [Trapelia coarctata]|nr:hypothetical protein [Trapelia coarctata]
MLYDVLKQFPALIPIVCSSQLDAARLDVGDYTFRCNSEPPWTSEELLTTFTRLIQQDVLLVKMCFFVDGLDEYDEIREDLLSVIKRLASSARFKLCFSSRVSGLFHDTLGKSTDQQLVLEKLTRDDIALYVKNKLESDSRYMWLKEVEPCSRDLGERIVQRANGFFLWVVLVVHSVLDSPMLTDDTLSTLLPKKLKLTPWCELRIGFPDMLDAIGEGKADRRRQIAQMLLVNLHAVAPLPLALVSYLIAEDSNPNYKNQDSHIADIDVLAAQKTVLKRLSTWSGHFLEATVDPSVDPMFGHTIIFLHPTAIEYLTDRPARECLVRWAGKDFNVEKALSNALLAELRTLPTDRAGSSSHKRYLQSLLFHSAIPGHLRNLVRARQSKGTTSFLR